jgi:hypothetical protein
MEVPMLRWRTCRKPNLGHDGHIVEQVDERTGVVTLLVHVTRPQRTTSAASVGTDADPEVDHRSRPLTGAQLEMYYRQYRVHHRGTRREWWETLVRPSPAKRP